MRLLFLTGFLLLTFGYSHAQNGVPSNEGLYPFRCGKNWGFSNSNGVLQVPCNYELVTFEQDFYTAYNSNLEATIFNAAGEVTAQADVVYNYEDGTCLLLTKLKNSPAGKAATSIANWENIYGYGWFRTAAGEKIPLPDTILKVAPFGGLLWTKNGNQQGIYSTVLRKYIVPLQPEPIQYVEDGSYFMSKRPDGKFDVTNGKGFRFLLPANAATTKVILDNRYFVLPGTRYGDIVYKLNGEPVVDDTTSLTYVREPEGNKIIAWLARKIAGRHVLYDLYDAEGLPVAKDVYKVQAVWKNTVLIDYLDAVESRSGYNMQVVDVATKKTLLSALTHHTPIQENNGFLIVEDTSQRLTIYYAGTGKKLFEVPPLIRFPEDQVVRVMGSRTGYDGFGGSVAFYALRKDTTVPYTVFDANGTVVSTDLESLYDYNNQFIIARKKGKSTMLNTFWKELLPPVYDDIQPQGRNAFRVTQQGKSFVVDSIGNPLDENSLLPVMTTAFKGWHLVLERKPSNKWEFSDQESEVIKATVRNADGTEIASWSDPKPGYDYVLTSNGKIMRYSSAAGSSIEVFDPQTQKAESVPYIFASLPEPDLPIVLIVRNKKGEMGVLSTLDFRMIVPAGKYEAFKIFRNPERPNGMMEGVFINGSKSRDQRAEIIGFYGINGVAFWKE